MRTQTNKQITDFIKEKSKASPEELRHHLQISPQALHRHLRKLIAGDLIKKVGSAPHVFYVLKQQNAVTLPPLLSEVENDFLAKRYLYINPQGQMLWGVEGLWVWAVNTKQEKNFNRLVAEYIETRQKGDELFVKGKPYVDATEKFKNTFHPCYVDQAYYLDFYSLPKFGKTDLGNLVLYAKQAQDRKWIKAVAERSSATITALIKKERIQSVAWVPHSLPRKVPFLKELKENLDLNLPEVVFVKAYSGEIPVPQKSLSKLEERIENAESTIFSKGAKIPFRSVLIIDDAVGSGATIQAVASKIKFMNPKTRTVGFAIVGSLKGFEVIKEV